MKKMTVALLGLLLSTAGKLYAQNDGPSGNHIFEPPANSIGINYTVRLAAGNKLRLDLANGYDVRAFRNLDSLLRGFLDDMNAFRDSLADPLTVKTIDYLIDGSGKKKVRIRQYRPAATTFLLDRQEPAILRTEQDTIRILVVTKPEETPEGRTAAGLRYDRVCFFVNRYDELASLLNGGLNDKIAYIIAHQTAKPPVYKRPFDYNIEDSVVSSDVHDHHLTQLELNAGVAVENYESYFAPSFVVNAGLNFFHGQNEHHFGVAWEPLYTFLQSGGGQLETFRNDLVVFHYSYTSTKPASPGIPTPASPPKLGFDPNFSLGYVFHRQGPFFPQPSFRITVGAARIPGGLKLEPSLFFNNFFKGVTPGIRVSLASF